MMFRKAFSEIAEPSLLLTGLKSPVPLSLSDNGISYRLGGPAIGLVFVHTTGSRPFERLQSDLP